MKITADTTDAQILGNLEAARQRVMNVLVQRADSSEIVRAANEVAEAEGEASAHIRYRNSLQNGATPEQALSAVMDLVLCGADDSWSGRGNDGKRAKFDGLRKAAENLKWN